MYILKKKSKKYKSTQTFSPADLFIMIDVYYEKDQYIEYFILI